MTAPAARNRETVAPDGSPAWSRLEHRIAWYDSKSQENQRWFKRLKVKYEKFLDLEGAGPYAAAPIPRALLAERVEGLVAQEHAACVSHPEEPARQMAERR
jgi:hypothetical protein